MTSIITEESVDSNVEKFSLFKNSRYKKWFIADTATEITTGLNSLAFPLLALHCTGASASAGIAGVGTASLPGNLPILVSMTLILIAICLCVASPEIRSLQRGTEWAVAENKN